MADIGDLFLPPPEARRSRYENRMAEIAAELAGPDDPVRATAIWLRGSWARNAGRNALFLLLVGVLQLTLGKWFPQSADSLAIGPVLLAFYLLVLGLPPRTFVAVTGELVLCYRVRRGLTGWPRGGTLAFRADLDAVTAAREGFRRRVLRISAPDQPTQVVYLGLSAREHAGILAALRKPSQPG